MTTNLNETLANAAMALTQAISERDSFKLENPEFNPVLTKDGFAACIIKYEEWNKWQNTDRVDFGPRTLDYYD
jgi:hypothetical protein